MTITLAGPSATKFLPAGPVLSQTATVSENGSPKAGASVSVTIAGQGSYSGITDALGQFNFNFVPTLPGTATLQATCSECSNTASSSVTVDTAQAPICKANPVDIASGKKLQLEADWQDSAPHPLSLTRTYSSAGMPANGLGTHWSHNYAGLLSNASGGTGLQSRVVTLGNGTSVVFTRNSLANPASPWVSDNGKDTLLETAQGTPQGTTVAFTFTRASDETQWLFVTNPGAATTTATSRLQTITQRNGWAMQLTYNGAGQLGTVTNAFGRSLAFSYNPQGLISNVTTPDAKTISYTYDSALRNIGVGYSNNTSRSYSYEDPRWPNALTGLTNEAGVRLGTYTYDAQGRTTGSSHVGNVDNYSFSYPSSAANGNAVGYIAPAGPVNPALYIGTTQLSDPLGNSATYTFQGGNGTLRLLSSTAPYGDGEVASRSFLPNLPGVNLPTAETDFLGTQTTFAWDTTRQLLINTTKAANWPIAQTTSTQWHPSFRLPVLVTEPDRTTATTYDALGNKLTETVTDTSTGQTTGPTSGQTRTWSWTYNPQGLVATSTDPRGNTSQYTYDPAGNLVSFKNPLNQQTTTTFDGAGRVLSQLDPNGLATTLTYDPRGRVLQTTRGTGTTAETTSYTYTPSGQINSASLPSGYAVTYTYDAAQRLIAATDNRNNRITYTLDAMGNRVREEIKDPAGTIAQLTTRTINNLNRVAAMSGAAGQTSQYSYDANGEPTQTTDPLNQTTRQTLDPLRRPVATTYADNATATQAWNPLDQLTQVTDPKGIATQYTRNAFGEITLETSPDIGTLSYTRDAAGNISASTDAKGQTTQITRDALDRPTTITQADGKLQQLSYDSAGAVSQILDASGSTTYSRDALSRILQKTQTTADNPANPSAYSVGYQYHLGGQVAQITYPSGLKVFYRKNPSGQLSQIDVQEPGGTVKKPQPLIPFVADLSYTALNQPKAWNWNCIAGAAPGACGNASRTFDTDGRMSANEFASYGYDAASRITSITQTLWASQNTTDPVTGAVSTSSFTTPLTWSAGYDSRNRLTSFNRNGNSATTSYTYDPNSNRLSAINKTTSDTDLDGDFDATDYQKTNSQALAVQSTSNKLTGFTQTLTTQRITNQSTQAAGHPVTTSATSQINYSLDANGNLTSDGLRTFEYDAANRLTKVQVNQSAEASKVTYLHNALGQRVFKSEPQVAQTAPSQTELGTDFITWLKTNFGWLFAQAQNNATLGQSYVYDEANLGNTPNLLGEYGNGGSKSAGRIEYIYLPTEDPSTGSGQAGAIPIGLYKSGKFFAIHSDHLGTPRLITDEANKPVWQWAYSAFGDNKPTGILKATANPKAAITNVPVLLKVTTPVEINLRFPGQYFDEESNLNYNYFRSYQPSQGRFTQADPVSLAGGWNRSVYVDANPLMDVDPEGLQGRGNVTPGGPGANLRWPSLGPSPSAPVGSTRSPIEIRPGTNAPGEIGGQPFSGHAFDRMQGRGIPPSAVTNTLLAGQRSPGSSPGTTQYYDPVNNVTVVANSSTGNVITVRNGPPRQSCP